MSRIINPEGAGKERTLLLRSVVLALRELMRQTEPDVNSRDLAAYIAIALMNIRDTVETSVTAWEKKGYWLKADRFRMEWEWTGRMADTLRQALLKEDWATIAMTSAQIAQKVMSTKVPLRNKIGTPWVGAWEQLKTLR